MGMFLLRNGIFDLNRVVDKHFIHSRHPLVPSEVTQWLRLAIGRAKHREKPYLSYWSAGGHSILTHGTPRALQAEVPLPRSGWGGIAVGESSRLRTRARTRLGRRSRDRARFERVPRCQLLAVERHLRSVGVRWIIGQRGAGLRRKLQRFVHAPSPLEVSQPGNLVRV